MDDTLTVTAPKQAWDILINMLDIAVKTTGLQSAEAALFWTKTIQAAAQAKAEAEAAEKNKLGRMVKINTDTKEGA